MNQAQSERDEVLLGDVGPSLERRLLFAAQLAAAEFYQSELPREGGGWPVEYLQRHGLEHVRGDGSSWEVGYVPDAWDRLTEHLSGLGFDARTLVGAGLAVETGDGVVVDAFRDRLMFVARGGRRLHPVGFVGFREGGVAEYVATGTTLIHRRSHTLVGVHEQKQLLARGAVPVVVNDLQDALAIGATGRLWVGVPMCGAGVSTAQAQMLRLHSRTRTVVVAVTDDPAWRRSVLSTGLSSLSMFFDRVLAVEMPAGSTPHSVWRGDDGVNKLDELLAGASRPLAGYRLPGGPSLRQLGPDSEPEPHAGEISRGP